MKPIRKREALGRARASADLQVIPEAEHSSGAKEVTPAKVAKPSTAECRADLKEVLNEAIGIGSVKLASRFITQVRALQSCGPSETDPDERILAACEMLEELKPENSKEAMLAVQMIGVHEAAVRFVALATAKGQTPEGCDANVQRATRLMRLFLEQLNAMAKLKAKGIQQRVTVEHVHVYPGGQAIVGGVRAEKSDRDRG